MKLEIRNFMKVEFHNPPFPFSGHFCFGFAREKCPKCGGILFVVFAPSQGEYSKLLFEKRGLDHKVLTTCVSCEFGMHELSEKAKLIEEV